MDVDLCIDLIFFFPPSPLLVAGTAAANDEKNHKREEAVIRGMVTRENIMFSHHSNRQIF